MEKTLSPVPCPMQCQGQGTWQWKKQTWDFYRCDHCKHLWIHPLPTQAELEAFYDSGYFTGDVSKRGYNDYEQDKQPLLQDYEEYLSLFEGYIHSSPKDLLDVGAATGVFCSVATRRGWHSQGLELSAYAVEQAQAQGRAVVQGSVETFKTEQKFDVVTAWDLVEHLPYPEEFFKACKGFLKESGYVCFSVPKSDSWFARILGRAWTLIAPPQHIHYFTQASITSLLEKHDFTVERLLYPGKRFSLSYVLHFVMGWTGISHPALTRFASWPFFQRYALRINPRDVMILFVRRTS